MKHLPTAIQDRIPALLISEISLHKSKILEVVKLRKEGEFVLILQGPDSSSDIFSLLKENLDSMCAKVACGSSDKDGLILILVLHE